MYGLRPPPPSSPQPCTTCYDIPCVDNSHIYYLYEFWRKNQPDRQRLWLRFDCVVAVLFKRRADCGQRGRTRDGARGRERDEDGVKVCHSGEFHYILWHSLHTKINAELSSRIQRFVFVVVWFFSPHVSWRTYLLNTLCSFGWRCCSARCIIYSGNIAVCVCVFALRLSICASASFTRLALLLLWTVAHCLRP